MRISKKNLIVSALHTNLDPEAWILVYADEGTASMFTNIVTTDPAKKPLAVAMLEAILSSLTDETKTPGQMKRFNPSNN